MVRELEPERREEFLELLGDPVQAATRLKLRTESEGAFDRVADRIEADHPGEWVAFDGTAVIATAPDLHVLLSIVDPSAPGVIIRSLASEKRRWMFARYD